MSQLAGWENRGPRIALTLLLIPLGRMCFSSWDESAGVPILSSINLAIHEFGHYLFMPFGETMTILGGSLFQCVFPLVFAGYFYFSRQHRDVHAATVCVWWCATNIAGVAIYANDARAMELMLITGGTGQEFEGHDFNNLFSMWGVLHKDTIYARRLRDLAGLVMFVSIAWGLIAAYFTKKPDAAAA